MKIRFIKDYFSEVFSSQKPRFKKGDVFDANLRFADRVLKEGYAVREKPTPEELIRFLRLPIRPQREISLPNLTPEVKRELENKQMTNDLKDYFSNKEMSVKDIAELYLSIYDYAIEKKDSNLIAKLAVEIRTLLNIVEFYDRQQKE